MSSSQNQIEEFSIPILFQFYNRSDTTLKVLEQIRKIKPAYLFLVQDGARNEKEKHECIDVKKKVLNTIDWNCEIKTDFRNKNLGPGKGTAEAIKWFFSQVEYGIVLEHDCFPNIDFFEYCKELLEKYKNTDSIKLIIGSNYQNNKTFGNASYYFGESGQLWGWAAWKSTFTNYKNKIDDIDEQYLSKKIKQTFKTKRVQRYWENTILLIKNKVVDTWDYQLLYSIWKENGLIILPNTNLISNIGFHPDAIHCKNKNSPFSNAKVGGILPLKHPKKIKRKRNADINYHDNYLGSNPRKLFIIKIKVKLLSITPKCIYSFYRKIKHK